MPPFSGERAAQRAAAAAEIERHGKAPRHVVEPLGEPERGFRREPVPGSRQRPRAMAAHGARVEHLDRRRDHHRYMARRRRNGDPPLTLPSGDRVG